MTDEEKLAACRVKRKEIDEYSWALAQKAAAEQWKRVLAAPKAHRYDVLQRFKHRVIHRGIGRRAGARLCTLITAPSGTRVPSGSCIRSRPRRRCACGCRFFRPRIEPVRARPYMLQVGERADLAVDGHRDQRRALAGVQVKPRAERLVSVAPAARLRPAFERVVPAAQAEARRAPVTAAAPA